MRSRSLLRPTVWGYWVLSKLGRPQVQAFALASDDFSSFSKRNLSLSYGFLSGYFQVLLKHKKKQETAPLWLFLLFDLMATVINIATMEVKWHFNTLPPNENPHTHLFASLMWRNFCCPFSAALSSSASGWLVHCCLSDVKNILVPAECPHPS